MGDGDSHYMHNRKIWGHVYAILFVACEPFCAQSNESGVHDLYVLIRQSYLRTATNSMLPVLMTCQGILNQNLLNYRRKTYERLSLLYASQR